MATKELRELRHQYKAAYTTYLGCVQALSDASQDGVWPSAEVLGKEERSLQELTFVRQALLDALYAHSMKTRNATVPRARADAGTRVDSAQNSPLREA
jgi:hypothetical protein